MLCFYLMSIRKLSSPLHYISMPVAMGYMLLSDLCRVTTCLAMMQGLCNACHAFHQKSTETLEGQ